MNDYLYHDGMMPLRPEVMEAWRTGKIKLSDPDPSPVVQEQQEVRTPGIVKTGDTVYVIDALPGYEWAKDKVGRVITTCEECWFVYGCNAAKEAMSACRLGNLDDPTVRIPRAKPQSAGHWDGYIDVGIPHSMLRIVDASEMPDMLVF